jgi:ATP-dependent DNA helicase RecG
VAATPKSASRSQPVSKTKKAPAARSGGAKRRKKPADSNDPFARFAKLGIRRPVDMLLHLPLRYEDLTRILPVASLSVRPPATPVQVQGAVVRCEVSRGRRRTLLVELDDDGASIYLRFFHFYPSQLKQFADGQLIRASGEVRRGLFGSEMVHPRYRLVTDSTPLPDTLTPVYPSASGISQPQLQKAVRVAFEQCAIEEFLPDKFLQQHDLRHLPEALKTLHWPPAHSEAKQMDDRQHPAWRRIILDELLAQQFALAKARARRAEQVARAIQDLSLAGRLQNALPFELTAAQQRVWREIAANLATTRPMNRLLQGDVGSGKTISTC